MINIYPGFLVHENFMAIGVKYMNTPTQKGYMYKIKARFINICVPFNAT